MDSYVSYESALSSSSISVRLPHKQSQRICGHSAILSGQATRLID